MRTLLLCLATCVAFSGLAKGDVVFSNLNASSGSASLTFELAFKVTTTGSSISGFFLGADDPGANKYDAEFLLNNANANPVTGSFVTNFQGTGISGIYYDLTSWAATQNLSAGTSYTLDYLNIDGISFRTNSSSITNNPAFGFYDTSYNGSNAQFAVVGVPEPGTLILGTLAACSGGAGVWWKRRRRQPFPAETADQPATD
jgi:hypothetical protein